MNGPLGPLGSVASKTRIRLVGRPTWVAASGPGVGGVALPKDGSIGSNSVCGPSGPVPGVLRSGRNKEHKPSGSNAEQGPRVSIEALLEDISRLGGDRTGAGLAPSADGRMAYAGPKGIN